MGPGCSHISVPAGGDTEAKPVVIEKFRHHEPDGTFQEADDRAAQSQ